MNQVNLEAQGCKLYVYLATETPRAVILRRGPTNWTQMSVWNTHQDTIEYGQWIKGRVYEEKSDLSPDGQKFLYFLYKHRKSSVDKGYSYAWTALSNPPYFTALALWPQNTTYGGGGIFVGNDTIWGWRVEGHPDHPLPKQLKFTNTGESYIRPGFTQVYQRRFIRGGWQPFYPIEPLFQGTSSLYPKESWLKNNPKHGDNLISRLVPYKWNGRWYNFQYWLLDGLKETPLEAVNWADFDQRGRLVFTTSGGQLMAYPKDNFRAKPELIADFNLQTPQEIISPDWAHRW